MGKRDCGCMCELSVLMLDGILFSTLGTLFIIFYSCVFFQQIALLNYVKKSKLGCPSFHFHCYWNWNVLLSMNYSWELNKCGVFIFKRCLLLNVRLLIIYKHMQFECIRVPALYNYHLFNLDINVGIKNKLITKARIISNSLPKCSRLVLVHNLKGE